MTLSPPAFLLKHIFSLRWLCVLVLLLAVGITWFSPKDDNSDAWSYHYYSGAMLLDGRLGLDYFGASSQGYLNPLVHVPFAAMVKAGWPDRLVSTAMALYSATALCLLAVFYSVSLGLKRWSLVGALGLSLSCLVVWTCTGSSVPDLFLQIPVLLALICLWGAGGRGQWRRLLLSGLCLGAAVGLKLTAIIYIPGIAVVLLCRIFRHETSWSGGLWYFLGAALGFLLSYGWWGYALYQQLGNPFFPFFNEIFKSPHFAQEAVTNRRFISWSLLEQSLLPFRAALSEPYTYIEMREPDLRPGVFVLSLLLLLGTRAWRKGSSVLKGGSVLRGAEVDFLVFLAVSLYVWVFISGNGRYAVGIFALLGGGVLVAMRAAMPFKLFRTVFLLILLLQLFVITRLPSDDVSSFRYSNSAWGGHWFAVDFSKVLGKGNQLVLTGTRSSYAVLEKDMGPNSALINVYGVYALENNSTIEEKVSQYEGRILGMVLATPDLLENSKWLEKVYFEQFSRFGLKLGEQGKCQFVGKGLSKVAAGGFIFCPLVRDGQVAQQYVEKTREAREYFERIETICPEVFSPRKYAVKLSEQSKEKYYANYEIDVYMQNTDYVFAKKQWSMMIFPLGGIAETYSMSADKWREKYCEPLRRSKAMSKE